MKIGEQIPHVLQHQKMTYDLATYVLQLNVNYIKIDILEIILNLINKFRNKVKKDIYQYVAFKPN